ncbi:Alpha-tectorin Precursor [Larimichthys crocea]|uniref:Alpha-tectorin n=1 Tax=Larimichthys crocea TaxID=215358 RepID=A0A6G0HYZ0_LARCR|nr:Alpha-tectorin Precursor [Larimichthys crocea]
MAHPIMLPVLLLGMINLDNRESGHVYYNQYTSGIVLQQATQDINDYFPTLNFNANWVFVATWYEVAYFPNSGTKTTVQAVLISGGQYSFVLMNYGDIAATARLVQAGYDTVNSTHHFTIPGSFSSNATGSKSTFRWSSNVNKPGRWAFRTDHGTRGCIFNGQPVQLGDSFWSDSTCAQKCTCTSEGLQCHSEPCSFSKICRPTSFQFSCQMVKRRTCVVTGDPHYFTFDGTVFHFQGTCTYVVSEQCGGGLPYYRVEGKNEHLSSSRVSWTRLVKVYVYNETIELVKGRRGEAKVNGIFLATPIYLNNGTVQVYESGFSEIISTDFGLEVSYNNIIVSGSVFPTLTRMQHVACVEILTIFLGMTSEPPSHFESQGTGCPATCVNPNSTRTALFQPRRAASAIQATSLVLGSVSLIECGCTFEGHYYRSGETVIPDEDCRRRCSCSYGSMTCHSHGCDPLESCKVVDGKRGCRPNSYATCWIRGPGSYHTFDGLTYQYPGACRLILAKVMGMSSHNHFSVTIEKTPRGLQGFDTLLKIEVEDSQVSIMSSSIVQVDGQKIRLPFSSASNRIQIYHSSIHSIILRTAFGVTVETDGSHIVHVTAPSIYNGSLGGLCGNYNGHPGDDFRTPNGILVNSSQVFGDSWRNGSLTAECVKSTIIIGTDCPPNSHYDLCGSPCPSTCPSLSFPFTCITVCKEGCFCDDGFVLDGNRCVRPTDCGCYHQERYVQAGEQFWDGEECQNLCTCNGTTAAVDCIPSSCGPQESCRVVEGEFGCHHKPNGICSASGDPHYLTFDGKAYDFQGTCRYVLATPCNATDNLPQFSVEAKNEPWFGLPFSITEEVFVNVSGYQVHLSGSSHGVVQMSLGNLGRWQATIPAVMGVGPPAHNVPMICLLEPNVQ